VTLLPEVLEAELGRRSVALPNPTAAGWVVIDVPTEATDGGLLAGVKIASRSHAPTFREATLPR
jgi:hypothetical protein